MVFPGHSSVCGHQPSWCVNGHFAHSINTFLQCIVLQLPNVQPQAVAALSDVAASSEEADCAVECCQWLVTTQ